MILTGMHRYRIASIKSWCFGKPKLVLVLEVEEDDDNELYWRDATTQDLYNPRLERVAASRKPYKPTNYQ